MKLDHWSFDRFSLGSVESVRCKPMNPSSRAKEKIECIWIGRALWRRQADLGDLFQQIPGVLNLFIFGSLKGLKKGFREFPEASVETDEHWLAGSG